MEYQKIMNLLDNTTNQPSKFRTKNWVEVNYDALGRYNINIQIKFKAAIINSSLCDYSDAYILVKGTISVAGAAAEAENNNDKKSSFLKNCAPFTNFISKINNPQVDNAEDIDVVNRINRI